MYSYAHQVKLIRLQVNIKYSKKLLFLHFLLWSFLFSEKVTFASFEDGNT